MEPEPESQSLSDPGEDSDEFHSVQGEGDEPLMQDVADGGLVDGVQPPSEGSEAAPPLPDDCMVTSTSDGEEVRLQRSFVHAASTLQEMARDCEPSDVVPLEIIPPHPDRCERSGLTCGDYGTGGRRMFGASSAWYGLCTGRYVSAWLDGAPHMPTRGSSTNSEIETEPSTCCRHHFADLLHGSDRSHL